MHDMRLYGDPHEQRMLAQIEQDYKILAEYRQCEEANLCGIHVIPSHASSLLWFGVLFTYKGIYANSVFRFSLLLPEQFPDESSLPTVVFVHDPMHPHVCPYTHSLDITPGGFVVWHKDRHNICQVLNYIQLAFTDPYYCMLDGSLKLEDYANAPAAQLYYANRQEFNARVRQAVAESNAHICDKPLTDDPHFIVFEVYEPEKHDALLERLRQSGSVKGVVANLSEKHRSPNEGTTVGGSNDVTAVGLETDADCFMWQKLKNNVDLSILDRSEASSAS